MSDKLSGTLMENLITLLAYSDEHGKIVSNIVQPNLFEGDYKVIAERCIDYWRRHGQAPKHHTADLVSDILEDKKNRKAGTYKRILSAMLALSESINTAYVIDQVTKFTRMQRIKMALYESSKRITSRPDIAVEEVESIWNDLFKVREVSFDPGSNLLEYEKIINYFQTHYEEFVTGIEPFDKKHVVPHRGAAFLILAAAKVGKTWALIHIGKHALLQRKKVLHISLEMSEEEVIQRYYQSLFSISKREIKSKITTLNVDEFGRIESFGEEEVKPSFTMDSPFIRDELEQRLHMNVAKFSNIKVKRFPTRGLNISKLRAYLDNLEVVERFIPDILILDYIGIMQTDSDNHRISLGRMFEELRGLAIERHVALVTAHQISKKGANSRDAKSTHVAEDWSLIATADGVITISKTDMEKKFGLARLYASNIRTEEDSFAVVITQNYGIGQFCLDATLLNNKYFDLMDEIGDGMEEDENDEEDD